MPPALRSLVILAVLIAAISPAASQPKYDPGASDTEIRIGNIMPYSGPASPWGIVGRIQAAYFKRLNDVEGGINGRKITFISQDDAYNPAKAVEQTRKLVESDEVLLMFSALGTPSNAAIQRYLNRMKVPQLFASTGASRWNDPVQFPWTMGWLPSYRSEARIYADYLLSQQGDPRVAVLYQNDDFGRDYLDGLRDAFKDTRGSIAAIAAYEVTEPSIDSQILRLKASDPDTVLLFTSPRFAVQAIRRIGEIGWKPRIIVATGSTSTASVMKVAGLDHAQGIISAAYGKDPMDPRWADDPDMKAYHAFLTAYMPGVDHGDSSLITGYNLAETLAHLLRQCGDDLTRENVMRQAANLQLTQPLLLPGIRIETSPTDFAPIEQMWLQRFEGESWTLFGDIAHGTSARN